MLTRLRIQNFKAWKDTGDIRLAPLTMFFGRNSSGKTSLQQFLLMLKQTAQSRDRRRVLHFGDADSLVDLGVWPEMVFNHDPAAMLQFELEWKHSLERMLATAMHERLPGIGPGLAFEASIGRAAGPADRIEVKSFDFRYRLLRHRPDRIEESPWRRLGMRKVRDEGYELSGDPPPFAPERDATAALLPPPVHFYGFELLHRRTAMTDELAFELEQQLEMIEYLGPLRQKPWRTYSWSGEAPENVGIEGERTVPALLAAQERFLYVRDGLARPFLEVIAQHLLDMGLLESFQTRIVAERRKEYELLVRTPGSPRDVSLTDVGFGVSQVLPVLVQCFYSAPGSTLVFEQPELHLHPRAQSELGDVFIDALHAHEGGMPRGIQLFIESHSEHLLRRIQRRIAEGRLKREDAALYFCSPGPEGSRIEELKLDDDGNITNWPENFFGDEMGDLVAMTEAAMKRQMEQGQE
ncbi:AAA family ATPase [Pyxidicoccus xibeiensis]|uniref:AAA family ATPase n=1 Tax=Pyxidicoccus xibeiensis TaxID=2906759 RepID=UPI0020A7F433|nr:DUF3696 domain-containing protein [Pyxidicoccus xibeiensis]MCP3137226.1 DUF3696 domain-containing protein [Pyxidicoccus xibeiensis]